MSSVTVALIQAALHWQQPAANHAHFERLMSELPQVDLIVLPEMFNTGFSMQSETISQPEYGETVQWMQRLASARQAAICGSVATQTAAGPVNRLWFVTPEGNVAFYDKKHLFRMSGEHHAYQSGNQRVVVNWRGMCFCLQVCYDLRFPVFSRNRQDYDALIYVANWPAARSHVWTTLLQARAIENQAFVLGCNCVGTDGNNITYSGDSLIVDYLGQPLQQLLPQQEGVLYAELQPEALHQFRQKFPAYLDADAFSLN
ncbi:amidohydrolase [Chromatiaceae bacterium AAb-1]|nr:amidohydrolase [Chromatiaceae bacterium AAb-1]